MIARAEILFFRATTRRLYFGSIGGP